MSEKDSDAQLPTVWSMFMVDGKPVGRVEVPAHIEAILTDDQKQQILASINELDFPPDIDQSNKIIVQIPTSVFATSKMISSRELLSAYKAWRDAHPEEML
jgi:hypothetical protein